MWFKLAEKTRGKFKLAKKTCGKNNFGFSTCFFGQVELHFVQDIM